MEDPDLLNVQIGLRIMRRRQELGLTQTALAKSTDMLQAGIAQIEHGERNVTIRTLCRLANALDTTVIELVGGPPPANTKL